jgi:uncharacterized protein YuzE
VKSGCEERDTTGKSSKERDLTDFQYSKVNQGAIIIHTTDVNARVFLDVYEKGKLNCGIAEIFVSVSNYQLPARFRDFLKYLKFPHKLLNILKIIQSENGRMVSSGMLRRVALIRNDFSEELSVSIIRVTRIG